MKQTTPAITAPLYLAYIAAQEALDAGAGTLYYIDGSANVACVVCDACLSDTERTQAEQEEQPRSGYIRRLGDDEDDESCDRCVAARDAALEAYIASDEPREWALVEEGYSYTTYIGTMADALAAARGNVDRANYSDATGTIWIDVEVRCELTGESDSDTVTLDEDAPECLDGQDHDWQSPYALVGGVKENPGVWGHGGGVIIHEACLRCGCGRTTDTWAQRRDTGEQGLTSVSYEVGKYDLDDLGSEEN